MLGIGKETIQMGIDNGTYSLNVYFNIIFINK